MLLHRLPVLLPLHFPLPLLALFQLILLSLHHLPLPRYHHDCRHLLLLVYPGH